MYLVSWYRDSVQMGTRQRDDNLSAADLLATGDYEWRTVERLPEPINSNGAEKSADMTADGLTIVFSSYRRDGYGAADLWMATRPDLSSPWSQPFNLGSRINTPESESDVAISADGLRLAFRSDGKTLITQRDSRQEVWSTPVPFELDSNFSPEPESNRLSEVLTLRHESADGSNGVDLFITERSKAGGAWSEPVRMPEPISSSISDGSSTLSDDGRVLIFHRWDPIRTGQTLWMTTRRDRDSSWSIPQKLDTIQSPDDAHRPRMLPDGKSFIYSVFSKESPHDELFIARLVRKDAPATRIANFETSVADHQASWSSLFNGEDLTGWKPTHPDTWSVREGELVSTKQQWGALVSDREFLNFEFETEVFVDEIANSGFYPKYPQELKDFPVYEVQIATSKGDRRCFTGGIYRGNQVEQFQPPRPELDGKWFALRIRVDGERIRSWIDDQPAADFTTQNGYGVKAPVALQTPFKGGQIKLRNMRIRELEDAGVALTPATSDQRDIANQIFELGGYVRFVDRNHKTAYREAQLTDEDFVINYVGYANKYLTISREYISVLSQLPHLETVYFGQTKLTDAAIDELAKLRNLKELHFKMCDLNDAQLAKLKVLPKLEMIELFHTELTNDGLKILAEFPALRRLTLENATHAKFGEPIINDDGLAHLSNVKNLELLWLMGPNFTDAAVDHLVNIKSLKLINIGAHDITEQGIADLKKRMHDGCIVNLASRLTNPGNSNYLDRSVPMTDFEEQGVVIDTKVGTTSMAVSPDGKLVATSSTDELEKINIWNTVTGKLAARFNAPGDFTAAPTQLSFSPDGQSLLMTVGETVFVVSAADGKTESSVDFPGRTSLVVFPKRTIALALYHVRTGGRKELSEIPQNLRIWNWKTGKVLYDEQFSDDVGGLRWSPSVSPDERFLIASREHYAEQYELKFDQDQVTIDEPLNFEVISRIRGRMVFSGNGKFSAYSLKSRSGMAAIFDTETRQIHHLVDPESANEENGGHTYGCFTVFTNDGGSYVTSDHTGRIAQWETETGELMRVIGYFKTSGNHITPLIEMTKDDRIIVAGRAADPRIVILGN